jgi:hypothetical protein
MKKQIIGFFVGLFIFAVTCLGTPLVAFHVGRVEAYFDIREGRRQFKRCVNWCVSADSEYDSMLAKKFGVKVVAVPPCSYYMEHQPSGERVDGYNRFQIEEINRLYGEGAFEKARDQFFQDYMRRIKEESGEGDALR